MASNIANLSVKLTANIAGFASGMANAAKPLASFSSKVAGVGSKVAALGAALGGGALVTGVSGLGVYAVKLAAEAEQARVSFTTMLGSAEKAKELQAQINSFAASTPFQTTELIGASKSLLAFGVAQDQIIPTMRTLGDLSAGLNIPLGELSELYGKARVQGRLYMEDINQLTGRGIPVIQQFAKQFGVAEGDVRKLVEQGKIGFPQLQQALVSLTSDGGQFAGMMAAQSQTMAGLYSTLEDTVTLTLTRIGETITEKLDLHEALTGVGESVNALATAALPVLEAFIGQMAEGGNIGQRAGELVLSGAELIATGLAYALNVVDLLAAGWRGAQAGVAYAIGGMLKGVDFLGAGIVKLLNLLPGVELEWTDTIGVMGDALIDEGNKLRDKAAENLDSFAEGSRVNAVGRFFDGVRANAAQAKSATEDVGTAAEQTALKIEQAATTQNAKVTETLDKLREQIAAFGQSDAQKLADQLRKAGATDAQIGEAVGLQNQLDGMEEAKKKADELQQRAKAITEATRSPMEKYESTIGELSELLSSGAIDWTTYGRAVQQARAELENTANANVAEAPDLFKAGSAQAARFAYDLSRGTQKLTRDEIPKKQYAEQQETNRLLGEVAKNTRTSAGPAAEVVDF